MTVRTEIFRDSGEGHLFVYGSLRPGFCGEMAGWLQREAIHLGPATAKGMLYRVDYYPGFVPGPVGCVRGDLFALSDPAALLAALDEHEECAPHFPVPHEYRRERLAVERPDGPVRAWTYVYARTTAPLVRIESGDFLA